CRDDFPRPPRLCCCLSGRHFDPPHRGCADADRTVNDGARCPGNPPRKPPAPTQRPKPAAKQTPRCLVLLPRQRDGPLITRHRNEQVGLVASQYRSNPVVLPETLDLVHVSPTARNRLS